MGINELTVGFKKGRVSRYCLVQTLNRLADTLVSTHAEINREKQSLGPVIEVKGGQVGGGR